MMTTPPGHRRYFMAKGSPSTPAPTMAVVLWNAEYHLQDTNRLIALAAWMYEAAGVHKTFGTGIGARLVRFGNGNICRYTSMACVLPMRVLCWQAQLGNRSGLLSLETFYY